METNVMEAGSQPPRSASYFRDVAKRFRRHKLAIAGLIVLSVIVLGVILLPLLLNLDPYTTGRARGYAPPSKELWMGSDASGRDNFARMLYGGRVSLTVGLCSTVISIVLGLPLGICAAYFGGAFEIVVMRLVDLFMSFPSMILIMVLVSIVGPSIWSVTIVIGILGWPQFARIIYASVLSVKEKEYVETARAGGAGHLRIITRYIVPNAIAPVIITATFRTASSILQESSLSFLGMGVQPPAASWGNILNAAQSISILTMHTWFWLPVGILLICTVLSINFVGDGLRDALDPRMKV